MHIVQTVARTPAGVAAAIAGLQAVQPNLILVFGAAEYFDQTDLGTKLAAAFPEAASLGCSTAGEITARAVDDGTCSFTGLRLETTRLTRGRTEMRGMEDSFAAGERLARQLLDPELKAVLVFGPGVQVNGSALVDGMSSLLGGGLPITGGLAGDGGAFRQTFTLGEGGVGPRAVVAIGLCGEGLRFAHGSFGGWEAFGPPRKVTRAVGNVLYELDGEPALAVYRRYLGAHARDLPASGLLFPFAMLGANHDAVGLIRTILGIDEASGSLTLAGEIDPEGYLKLMHATTDKLVGGAEAAAEAAHDMLAANGAGLAILVSCVGRKLVMGSRVDEEVEAVSAVFGHQAVLSGFYSYGEISPFTPGTSCKLHNQTMTITYLGER